MAVKIFEVLPIHFPKNLDLEIYANVSLEYIDLESQEALYGTYWTFIGHCLKYELVMQSKGSLGSESLGKFQK